MWLSMRIIQIMEAMCQWRDSILINLPKRTVLPRVILSSPERS